MSEIEGKSALAGSLAVACAAVLWAAGGTVARGLVDRGASPVELTQARSWIALAGLGVVLALKRERRVARGRAGIGFVIAFGLSLAIANLTYYLAVSMLPVAVGVVIQYTAPALVVAWTALVARRSPGRTILGALLCVLAGVLLLSGFWRSGRGSLDPLGLAAAVVAAVAFAAYMVTGERVGRALGSVRAVFSGFAVASVFWLVVLAVRHRTTTFTRADLWPGIVFLGLAATLVPFLLFVWGLERVDASRAGIVSTLEPLAAGVFAWIWLGQALRPVQLAGAAMVIIGIGVVQMRRPVVEAVGPPA